MNTGIEPAAASNSGLAGRIGRVVGVEHVAGRRLRVAAGVLAAEPLVAPLDLVAARPLREK